MEIVRPISLHRYNTRFLKNHLEDQIILYIITILHTILIRNICYYTSCNTIYIYIRIYCFQDFKYPQHINLFITTKLCMTIWRFIISHLALRSQHISKFLIFNPKAKNPKMSTYIPPSFPWVRGISWNLFLWKNI